MIGLLPLEVTTDAMDDDVPSVKVHPHNRVAVDLEPTVSKKVHWRYYVNVWIRHQSGIRLARHNSR